MAKFLLFLSLVLTAGCGSPQQQETVVNGNSTTDVARSGGGQVENASKKSEPTAASTACYTVPSGDMAVLRSQTFAIDFEPFKGACFVTLHDPEFTDPPLGAELAVYKAGKKVEAFFEPGPPVPIYENGKDTGRTSNRLSSESLGATCWVEAVAFQDINDDYLTDVILVAKCGTKGGPYQDNRIYINNGELLVKRDEANTELSNFKTVKDIVNYTKQNPRAFSLTVDAANSNR
jgi:hypothetical protein